VCVFVCVCYLHDRVDGFQVRGVCKQGKVHRPVEVRVMHIAGHAKMVFDIARALPQSAVHHKGI
jgi:hypothetical protein